LEIEGIFFRSFKDRFQVIRKIGTSASLEFKDTEQSLHYFSFSLQNCMSNFALH